MKKIIYIFDFDGTITSKDSFLLFSFYSIGFLASLNYWITVFLCYPFIPKWKLKESFFKNFKGVPLKDFNSSCVLFFKKCLHQFIRNSFFNYIAGLNSNAEIVIVTASVSNYIKPWCDKMGFDLIATELEVVNEKITGRFSTPNCNYQEKVVRIQNKYNLSKYTEIHVFGNSKGDFDMLELGTHKYYNFFD